MRRVPSGAPILSAAAMRAAEQACFHSGTAQAELMERAGAAIAREAARLAIDRPILVLAGPGNNGGDAYVAARLLAASGHDVEVAALGQPGDGAARAMREQWRGPTTALGAAKARPVVIDGLFGTGVTRDLSAEVAEPLGRLGRAAERVLAIDLPSGIDTDTGETRGAAGADVTVALGALKPAHLLADGRSLSGHVLLADIGIPVESSWATIPRPRIAPPATDSHKYSRGMVLVVTGAMPGAARLAARAALSGGAGYVVLAGDSDSGGPDAIVHRSADSPADLTELLSDDRIGAVVVGPGLGRDRAARDRLEAALASERDLVLDGDALTLLGKGAGKGVGRRRGSVWLTPHSGEFDRMFGSGGGSKIERTLAASAASGAVIVHKGPDTVIGFPDGRAVVSAAASPWLSTAGTGDVLAGLLAARHAAAAGDAVSEAVWLHARVAALAGPAFIADDLIPQLPRAIAECL